MLHLRLLGPIEIRLGGTRVPAPGRDKTMALLAYLAATTGRSHAREDLAQMLWPAMPRARSLHNLRQALLRLRGALSAVQARRACLAVDARTVAFERTARFLLDVEPFLESDENDLPALERRAALYRGPFMEDLACPAGERFEEWVAQRRDECHRMALMLEGTLATAHERAGRLDLAVRHARRAAALEPWNEAGQRRLLRLLALSGQPEAALSHFAALRETLRRELHIEVQDETLTLAGQIARTAAVPAAPVRLLGGIPLPSAEAQDGVRSPASIALRFEQAGRALDAARWCLRAARCAARRSAWAETAGFARRALKALSKLPEGDTLDELALAALLLGAQAHVARGGYYDVRAQHWYGRADRLMGRPNADRRGTLGALRGRWVLASSSASHREAMAIAERMIAIAQAGGLDWMRGVACYLAGNSGLWLGEFERAFAQLTESVDLLRRTGPDASELLAHEQDFEATATGYLGWAHWHLGRTEVALELGRNALRRAQESAHAPTWMHVAVSFGSIAIGAVLPEEVSEIADRIVQRAERHGLAMWADIGRLQRHWARACVGDDRHSENAAAALERLHASYPGGAAGFQAIHAESCLFLDDRDRMREALARLRDALHRTQAAAFAAPLHRLEGELARREGRPRDAERALHRAVELALAQRSPALEARARAAALAPCR